MDCLKCPNYWGNTPDEDKCAHCADTKTLGDVLIEMPPLFMGKELLVRGYHLQ